MFHSEVQQALVGNLNNLRTLKRGDFTVFDNNNVAAVISNKDEMITVACFQAKLCSAITPMPYEIAAPKIVTTVPLDDPKWPEFARRFFTENVPPENQ